MTKLILIDVTRLVVRLITGKKSTGVDRVSLAYVAHFSKSARAVLSFSSRVVVLSEKNSTELFEKLLNAKHKTIKKTYWLKWFVVFLTSSSNNSTFSTCLLFNTGHKGLDSIAYGHTLVKMGVRPIFFIHDLIPLTHAEYCRPNEDVKHKQRITQAIKLGAGLILNSTYTECILQEFAKLHHLQLPTTIVSRLSAEMSVHSSKQVDWVDSVSAAAPYFVMLGTVEPRKNHLMILQGARALLFPSFVEGYGIPLVESLQLGTPVIASDIPVFREIGQDVPDFINTLDGLGWLHAIKDYMQEDSAMRKTQLARMKNYTHWSWSDHFAVVDDFMDDLDKSKNLKNSKKLNESKNSDTLGNINDVPVTI